MLSPPLPPGSLQPRLPGLADATVGSSGGQGSRAVGGRAGQADDEERLGSLRLDDGNAYSDSDADVDSETASDRALGEIVEAVSYLALGAITVPFGENEVMLLNAALPSLSDALKAILRAGDRVGGEPGRAAQGCAQALSGVPRAVRQLNQDISALCPLVVFSPL